MGRFIFLMLFHRVIALLKQLLGTLKSGESLFFYLDLDIGLPWVNFKAINLKFSQIVNHIVFLQSVNISHVELWSDWV